MNSVTFTRRPFASAVFLSSSLSLPGALVFFFLSPSRWRCRTSSSESTAAATSQRAVWHSRAITVAVWRKLRITEEDMGITHAWRVGMRLDSCNTPASAVPLTRRDRNSARDLRKGLNTRSLDVSGYTGESSYIRGRGQLRLADE
jgi:hypothetical protein